jgi:hypothetical protein
MILFLWSGTIFSEEQVNYSLPIIVSLEIYPQEICYRDVVFSRPSIQNKSDQTIHGYIKDAMTRDLSSKLKNGEKTVYVWDNVLDLLFQDDEYLLCIFGKKHFPLHAKYSEIPPQSNDSLVWRLHWLPMPEFSQVKIAQEFKNIVHSGGSQFQLKYDNPLLVRDAKNNKNEIQIAGSLMVKQRPNEEIVLLQKWYLELPSTTYEWTWRPEFVFANPRYVDTSPYNEMPKRYRDNRDIENFELFYKKINTFFTSMEHRTPELLSRIQRTNELASQLLERAKQPNSTISQNMAEFIQLRGLFVEIRYAENDAAEKAVFEKLIDFINMSHDKQLWVDFIYEIGLNSIYNDKYFPHEKVKSYQNLFAERFHL